MGLLQAELNGFAPPSFMSPLFFFLIFSISAHVSFLSPSPFINAIVTKSKLEVGVYIAKH